MNTNNENIKYLYFDMHNFQLSLTKDFRIEMSRNGRPLTRDMNFEEILFFNMHYYPLVRNTDEQI